MTDYEKKLQEYLLKRAEEDNKLDVPSESKNIIEDILDSLDVPSSLFRYRSFNDYTKSELKDNYIYLSDIPSFNDPYDSLGFMTEKFMINNKFVSISVTLLDWCLRIYSESRDIFFEYCKENRLRDYASQIFDHLDDTITNEELSDIFGFFEKAYQRLQNKEPISDFYTRAYGKLKKIMYAEYKFKKTSHLRIACFTENNANIPMWAHYADAGKGICIEYDTSPLNINKTKITDSHNKSFIAKLLKVHYTTDFKYTITGLSEEEILFSSIFKHKDWSYEKEWRLSTYDTSEDSTKQNSRFYGLPIKAIYLGYNNNEQQINCIKHFLNNTNSISKNNINLYRMTSQNDCLKPMPI